MSNYDPTSTGQGRSSTESIVLFGIDSIFAVEIIETVARLGGSIRCGVLTGEPEWDLRDVRCLVTESELDDDLRGYPVVVPWVTPAARKSRIERARAAGFQRFPSLIDPNAVVASTADLSEGVFINAGAVVGAFAAIGPHVLLNRNVSVGHHSVLDELVSTGPGVSIAGRCRFGRETMLGTGSSVAPGTTIGGHSVVAVGAAVLRDVPGKVVVMGNPARTIKGSSTLSP